jgi:NAD-dependent DNA ligase
MDKLIQKYNSLNISKYREELVKLPIDMMKKLKKQFDNRYYNTGEDTIDDLRYDIFIEVMIEKDPLITLNIGTKLRDSDNKVSLPFHLGSMEKIKKGETHKLEDWTLEHHGDYILSDKLNGVSCLVIYNNGGIKLYTRGDGLEGSDISYFSSYISSIPRVKQNLAVRGEFIISTHNFEKYKDTYKNALSLIVGTINSKTIKEPLKDIEFIAYEIVEDQCSTSLENNILKLKSLGFSTVQYSVHKNIDLEILSKYLTTRKQECVYDIDGIIVHINTPYNRNNINANGNPKYAFAFKMLMEVAEVIVEDVEWNVSKWGIIKPTIRIQPTELTGITIKYTTGFNASYINNNKINRGSKIVITRSGDIIPYIVQVITHSQEPKMPDIPYSWNESGVDILVSNKDNEELIIQRLVHFFVSMNIKNINEGIVKKLVNNNFDTVIKILSADIKDFLTIPTIKEKMAEKMFNNIHDKLKNIHIPDLMCASGCFGFGLGKKKANTLFNALPELLENTNITISMIESIEGFSTKSAEKIIKNIPLFKKFIEECAEFFTFKEKEKIEGNRFNGKKYVFSGFRDKDLEDYIAQNGGQVLQTISSKTDALIVLNTSETSVKIRKAKELNIKIIEKESFNKL